MLIVWKGYAPEPKSLFASFAILEVRTPVLISLLKAETALTSLPTAAAWTHRELQREGEQNPGASPAERADCQGGKLILILAQFSKNVYPAPLGPVHEF